MDHNKGDLLNAIIELIVEIIGEKYGVSIEIKAAAREVLRQLIDSGIEITKQVIEQVAAFLIKVRQGADWAYKKTKDAVYEILECVKATTGFIGRLFESVVVFGFNCVQYCRGRITGEELFDQTCQSVDNIMNPDSKPDSKPLVGAAAGAVTGAAIGSVVSAIGTTVGGLAGFVIGSFLGVTVARNT